MRGIGHSVSKEAWEDGKGVKGRCVNSKGTPAKVINALMGRIQSEFTEYEVNCTKTSPPEKELNKLLENS
jgi:hypothetical protein